MKFYAPGKVFLLGEHAIVYQKLAVGVAIDRFAEASAEKIGGGALEVQLADFDNVLEKFDDKSLRTLYNSYISAKNAGTAESLNSFVNDSGIDEKMLPFATIASRLLVEFGAEVIGMKITISSAIPIKSGLSSSAACATAFTAALVGSAGLNLKPVQFIDVARDGERIVHRNFGAGRMDVSASYLGGIVSYKSGRESEALREEVGAPLNIVVINTGPKKSTAETVGHVRELLVQKPEFTNGVINRIDACSTGGLELLKKRDLRGLGAKMNEDQELLASLDLSTERLDSAIGIARKSGAYGAKLSGGGGGGIAIALADDPGPVIDALQKAGFEAYSVGVATKGASTYLKSSI